MYDVITIGSALKDVFAEVAEAAEKASKKEQEMLSFALDSKIPIKDLHYHLGGGGINSAFVMDKIGVKVAPYIKVGSDIVGKEIKLKLEQSGISTEFVREIPNQKTGMSVAIHDIGENGHISFNYKGASDNIDINQKIFTRADWIYLTSLSGQDWRDDIREVQGFGKDVSLAWNPGSEQIIHIDELQELLEFTNILILNKFEAEKMASKFSSEKLTDLFAVQKLLQDKGPEIVVITNGKEGASIYDGEFVFQADASSVSVVDSTGAGDTFGATFVAGKILGQNIEKCLQMAIVNAAAVTSQWGAQNGLLGISEIEKRLSEVKINKQ